MKIVNQKIRYFGNSDLDGGISYEVLNRVGLSDLQVIEWLEENSTEWNEKTKQWDLIQKMSEAKENE